MAKFGFFLCSKINIFTCTIRKGWPCFDWYLEASKTRNNRVTSSQKSNKRLLESIRTKKADFATGLVEQGSHVWHLCHLTFDFGASLYHLLGALLPFGFWYLGTSLPFVSFGMLTPGWWSSGLVWCVGLVWVHRQLIQTVWANMWIAHSKVAHSSWEPLGKIF